MMKRLPIHRRPYFCKSVLEVGGGHAPFAGVTHAVDKFPHDDRERAARMLLPAGVEFREGELEALPFANGERFDFMYVSHVFEHTRDPEKAVSEINRITRRGYLETPSPLREQLACPIPYDAKADFHPLFCWASRDGNTLHVVRKTEATIGNFCDCTDGKLARALVKLHRDRGRGLDLEPLLPLAAKTTWLYFEAPVALRIHPDFASACREGECGYRHVRSARRWASWPFRMISGRFNVLKQVLAECDPC